MGLSEKRIPGYLGIISFPLETTVYPIFRHTQTNLQISMRLAPAHREKHRVEDPHRSLEANALIATPSAANGYVCTKLLGKRNIFEQKDW